MKIYSKIIIIVSILIVSIILFKFIHIIAGASFFIIGMFLIVYFGFIKKENGSEGFKGEYVRKNPLDNSDMIWEYSEFTQKNWPDPDYDIQEKQKIYEMSKKNKFGYGVIDVGAHIGDLAIPLAMALSNTGRSDIIIYAIDPTKEKCDFMKKIVDKNKITNIVIIHAGLSDKKEYLEHKPVSDNNTGATIWDINSDTDNNLFVTLDSLFLNGVIGPIGLYHIDVEGHEEKVLIGSRQVINKFNPIVCIETFNIGTVDRCKKDSTDIHCVKIAKLFKSFIPSYSSSGYLPNGDLIFEPDLCKTKFNEHKITWTPVLISNPLYKSYEIYNRPKLILPIGCDLKFGAADPFIINNWIFCELMTISTEAVISKGYIGVARLNNDILRFTPVIDEKFHMSFPYVFYHDNSWYMIPEVYKSGNIFLYKSNNFPFNWERIKSIYKIDGIDSIPFKINNKWYLFTTSEKTKVNMILTTDNFPEGIWYIIKKNILPLHYRGGGSVIYTQTQVIIPIQPYTCGNKGYGCKLEMYSIDNNLDMKLLHEVIPPYFAKGLHHLSIDPFTGLYICDLRDNNNFIKYDIL